jgi:hypothetical protein
VAIEDDLLAEIRANIGPGISVGATNAAAAWDVFEVYVLTLVLRAAEIEGATVSFEDVYGSSPTNLVFRTSPGANLVYPKCVHACSPSVSRKGNARGAHWYSSRREIACAP